MQSRISTAKINGHGQENVRFWKDWFSVWIWQKFTKMPKTSQNVPFSCIKLDLVILWTHFLNTSLGECNWPIKIILTCKGSTYHSDFVVNARENPQINTLPDQVLKEQSCSIFQQPTTTAHALSTQHGILIHHLPPTTRGRHYVYWIGKVNLSVKDSHITGRVISCTILLTCCTMYFVLHENMHQTMGNDYHFPPTSHCFLS